MKWWNKKQGRSRWTVVEFSSTKTSEIVTWCKQSPSTGKFYANTRGWYFEHAEDATLFLLKWGGNARTPYK